VVNKGAFDHNKGGGGHLRCVGIKFRGQRFHRNRTSASEGGQGEGNGGSRGKTRGEVPIK